MECFIKIPLRTLQIAIHVLAIVFAFCTFLPLGYIWKYFQRQCVFYAKVKVSVNASGYVFLDTRGSSWGDASACDFTTYVTVVTASHAFIWCWFCLLMKATLKAESREHYMQLPGFFMHSIMFVVVFVSSSIISAGANAWCSNLTKALNYRYTCAEAAQRPWDVFKENDGSPFGKHNFYSFLLLAKISSWLLTLSLLAQTLLTGFKLYKWFLKDNPDYKRSRTKIEDVEKSKSADDKTDFDTMDTKDSTELLSDDS